MSQTIVVNSDFVLRHIALHFPITVFLVLALAYRVLRLVSRRLWSVPAVASISAISAFGLLISAALYLALPVAGAKIDVASVGAAFLRGQPIYPSLHGLYRYMLLYGPAAFLAPVPFYALFGVNLFTAKLPCVLALACALMSMFLIGGRYQSYRGGLIGVGLLSFLCLEHGQYVYSTADALMLCAVAGATAAFVRGGTFASLSIFSIALALEIDLKVHGFLILVPLWMLLWRKCGALRALCAFSAGILLASAVFLFPQVSLFNYAALLRVMARHSLHLDLLSRNVQWTLLLLLGCGALGLPRISIRPFPLGDSSLMYFASIAACMFATCVFAAKPGSGPHHLMPYGVPLIHAGLLFLDAQSDRVTQYAKADWIAMPLIATLLLFMLFAGGGGVKYIVSSLLAAPQGRETVAALEKIGAKYRGSAIQMGAGDRPTQSTDFGLLLIAGGQPYIMNNAAIWDLQFGGIEIPLPTRNYVTTCQADVWLIPASQKPFGIENPYYAPLPHPAYDKDFQRLFRYHYERLERIGPFDIWFCKEHLKKAPTTR